jgi:hypothetical protein
VQGESHGIMFLCEAAMGKVKEITRDDSSLVKAPDGFDSIIAKGTQACTLGCMCAREYLLSAAAWPLVGSIFVFLPLQ